jgi:signal transduction histidine kinase
MNGDNPEAAQAAASSPATPVSLTTAATGNRVRITIADRGVGIAPADLAHVFDPYFTTKRGGTGLGLPIAKNIVEGLSGTVSVSSTPGRGTEMQITLPLDSLTERA